MLDIMNLRKRLSSLIPVSSLLTLIALTVFSGGSASCGSDQACFYFTQVEYDLGNSCPSRDEALTFFRGDFCTTPITAVDSDGVFDGTTCCYDVTESNDFFDCGIGPVPPPEPGVVTSGGGGGAGAQGGGGAGAGAGGAGGNGTCVKCAEFILTPMPPSLCEMSVPIYEAYSECKCLGACKSACADACSMQSSSTTCDNCMTDTMNGCGTQSLACVDDN
jgi:hypothetical protein